MSSWAGRSADRSDACFAADVDVPAGRMWLHGELDAATAPLLDEAAEMLITSGSRCATICLADLDFIDAAGLAAPVKIQARLSCAGRRLALIGAAARVRRAFDCSGLGRMLTTG